MNQIHILTLPFGAAFSGPTELPLAKIPTGYGGITVVSAELFGPGAGTAVGGLLVSMSNQGTPAINGTVATFTTPGVTAAGVRITSTVGSTPFVAAGDYLGFDQTSGTIPAGSFISVGYLVGKAA